MFTLAFWKATAERAIATAAQTVAALAGPVSWWTDIDVTQIKTMSIAALSAVVFAVMKALGANVIAGPGPSFVPGEEVKAATDTP